MNYEDLMHSVPFVLQLDFKALLLEVDESFLTWRKPAALIFGGTSFSLALMFNVKMTISSERT